MNPTLLRLLRWTELEYAEFQYNAGLDYLHQYIPEDVHGIDMLSRNRIFWRWWTNHWSIRDEAFMEQRYFLERIATYKVQRLYRDYNSNLVNEIYPNAQVLGSDYCRMIGQLNDAK